MGWSELFDAIFNGPDGSERGSTQGAFSKYALSQYAAQVPYIGQYLGFYFAGYEDLSDLTTGLGDPADLTASKYDLRKEFGIERGDDNKLLRNPNLLAANDSLPSNGKYQEIQIDTDVPLPSHTSQRPSDSPQEVVVHGIRPDRSKSPPLPSPHRHALPRIPVTTRPELHYPRPELQSPPRPEAEEPPVQWTQEVVITADPLPFNREESDPEALSIAEGIGRIQMGDLEALMRGGYNGIVSALQQLVQLSVSGLTSGPAILPIVSPILEAIFTPYAEDIIGKADEYKLSINPRYGGSGIVGEELSQNLLFEVLPLAPKIGKLGRRAFRATRYERRGLIDLRFLGIESPISIKGGQSSVKYPVISKSQMASGFRSVRAPSITYVHLEEKFVSLDPHWGVYQVGSTESLMESTIGIVDHQGRVLKQFHLDKSLHTMGVLSPLEEAKAGSMGQLNIPERYNHFVHQSNFLIDYAQSSGRSGVIYRVETKAGQKLVLKALRQHHKRYLKSGFLKVFLDPL